MKHKTLVIAALAACCHPASAALVTFETFILAPESFLNSSPGEFTENDFVFNNTTYDDDSWSGFAISNITDNTLSPTNEFSAVTGGGFGGSANYAIGQYSTLGDLSTYVTFPSPIPESLVGLGAYFTNTAWVVYDMLNGDDGFGSRPFDGDIPDFFKLVIQGYDSYDIENGNKTGEVEFYLANFTGFTAGDDPNDYIVQDWRYVDFSALGSVAAIQILIESSDPNKPMYFAMDHFLVVPEPSSLLMALGGLGLLLRRKR